ncbi:glycosyltransferase family 4 protein [Luteimonas fraxinea]|uniref:glycosyltransferase family 4 protein n=1 Tax=Luteimonas fraxinea TaxID=2901869 RepID=UPI001E50DF6F|nr:glycosyltransferase family 4 protein [Luteimonas fraxinea]MCD9124376.1 glycosyltransferase family 4 protein [Luteimonas fraxinea]
MRTLLVTRNLPPLVGGMECLNQQMCRALAQHGPLAVIGPTGCTPHVPEATCVNEVPASPVPMFSIAALASALRMAREFKPTHVLAGSGLTAPFAWAAARRARVPYLVYVHGLDLIAPSLPYQLLWLPFIRNAGRVVTNSRNTAGLARERGVPADRLRIVTPGTAVPPRDIVVDAAERTAARIGSGPVLLSVGRLTARKGLAEFVQHVMPSLLKAHPALQLVVVGGDASDAIAHSGGSESRRITQAALLAGVSDHVSLRGQVEQSVLDLLYRCADIHIFPIRDLPGDVEGFGMVALEAAARGVPTLAYEAGGVADAIDQGRTGELAPADDANALAQAILRWLQKPRSSVAADCRSFAAANGWDIFERRLIGALQ